MKEITDDMFCQLVDMQMSEPVPLKDADLTQAFIYDRDFGVFYVSGGFHAVAMSMLFAWKHNERSVFDLKRNNEQIKSDIKENTYSSSDKHLYLADRLLTDFKGTAMGSSVSDCITIGKLSNLNETEKMIFSRYKIELLEER